MAASLLLVAGCGAASPPVVLERAPSFEGQQVPPPLNLGDGTFERVAEQDGVAVFARPSSSLIRIGAQGRLPAPPRQVRAALLDYARHAAVLDRVSECRVLKQGSDWLLLYQRLSLPVIDDRDFTLRVTWGEHDGRHWIRYRAVRAGPPPKDGVVRVTDNFGGWDLLPVEDGRATLARYQSNMDMAGSLPGWMSQSGALDELPSLYRAMCSLLPAPHARLCRS